MPALSFSVFKDKILSGAKRQTIRSVRKHPIKEGDVLYMYWKQRSQTEREKLGEAKCTKVFPVKIEKNFALCPDLSVRYHSLDLFAQADGFDNWQQLIEFFDKTHGLPFTGVLIEWDDIIKDPDPKLVEALNDWSFRTDYRGNDNDGSLQVQIQIC